MLCHAVLCHAAQVSSGEYIQMSGRAGRRGLDDKGAHGRAGGRAILRGGWLALEGGWLGREAALSRACVQLVLGLQGCMHAHFVARPAELALVAGLV